MSNSKYMKQLFSCFIGICCLCFAAQAQKFTLANVHSHNDYEQKVPFDLAYRNQLGSIEADIHLVAGKFLCLSYKAKAAYTYKAAK